MTSFISTRTIQLWEGQFLFNEPTLKFCLHDDRGTWRQLSLKELVLITERLRVWFDMSL